MASRFTQISVDDDVVLGEFYNKRIPIMNSDKKSLTFQMPRMYLPFGLSGFVPPSGPTKWNLDFVMKGWNEPGGYVNKYYDWVRELENKVISHIHENSQVIFGAPLSRQEIEGMFNSNLKESQNGYDPKLRVKADTWPDGNLKFKVFDEEQVDVTEPAEKDLFRQHSGIALVELNGIWFFQRKWGITWRTTQLQIFKPRNNPGGGGGIPERPGKCLIDFSAVADI